MFTGADAYDIDVTVRDADVRRVLAATPADVSGPPALTFARNVFVPLTTACRYTCTYCTYYDVPGEASLMSPEAVRETLQTGADAGCTEALFTFGDEPDDRYEAIHDQLGEWGYGSIHDYLYDVCEMSLEEGLLPHSNPGDLTEAAFEALAPVNASMGVMLETTADVDAHAGSRRKTPGQRLNTIRAAGRVGVPFTTGILVGIGEDRRDRAESLLAIADLHERYDHVQEVIIQPVVPNERSDFEGPTPETLRETVAMARVALPQEVSVQAPPNLAPVRELVECGVDDLGGVSPVTDDYINPDYAWPALDELREVAETAGVPLYERLPVHDRYLPDRLRRASVTPAGPPRGGGAAAATDGGPEGAGTARPVGSTGGWLPPAVLEALDADGEYGRRFRAVAGRETVVEDPA
jgi:FO synthase subunit 1